MSRATAILEVFRTAFISTESFDPMDFDHRNRDDKVSEISNFTAGWDALKEEIAKCDLVCANCHRIRTSANKQWCRRPRSSAAAVLPATQLSLLPVD